MKNSTCSSTYATVPKLEVIKPHFFSGQYLNDDDLQSIINWAQRRFELQPSSLTWGIVCGLRLSLGTTAKQGNPVLRISCGYGFDACQRLCIVDTPKDVPLPSVPCELCDNRGKETIQFGPYTEVPHNQISVFDYFLEPSDIDARKSVGASKDGTRNCSVVRYKVGAKVSWKRVCLPIQDIASEPSRDKESPELELLSELQKMPWWGGDEQTVTKERNSEIRKWLKSKVKKSPELLRNWPSLLQDKLGKDSEVFDLRTLVELLSLMCFSLRMTDDSCEPDEDCLAIPIARVWIRTQGNEQQVVWIDDRFPYRKHTTSAPAGFDLRHWIGRDFQETQQAAAVFQIKLENKAWVAPNTVEGLRKFFFDEPTSSSPDAVLAARCTRFYGAAETVMGFELTTPPATRSETTESQLADTPESDPAISDAQTVHEPQIAEPENSPMEDAAVEQGDAANPGATGAIDEAATGEGGT